MSDDTRPAPGGTGPDDGGPGPDDGPRFRLGYVPGATPGKWARTWRERLPGVFLELVQVAAADVPSALRDGEVDAAIGRLPVDKETFHAIPLYAELPVVVVSRDHLVAATEESERVAAHDLADDVLWVPRDDVLLGAGVDRPGRRPEAYDDGTGTLVEPVPASTEEAIAWAATGSGVVVTPMSLARLHHRKDTVNRVVEGVPESPVGLVWCRDGLPDDVAELVEELVGIVRGRTANSSRGRGAPDEARSPKKAPAKGGSGSKGGKGAAEGKKAAAARRGKAQGPRGSGSRGRGRPGQGRRGR
ncbi:DNA-binding transcriptional LysR family regulator [Isoptericola sp. CG 20/1183]|uniref:DNA-binding transcriptional LysR family regulator n=1 Tax=Isoptericola halotolerans TaxID=300560 RepID=A0ABX5EDI0_9MICO|nr:MULTISPECIES: LysR substrate-binding domain-containing protein [Isoptericola]PRZ06468.1 DNA-binding transcriptional LysR family regulator [Isoptericola halotolerans]PRZ06726.1 DNA-binding transcriptional LysR family regulator [Isoptericola sp. CG 20/1183]